MSTSSLDPLIFSCFRVKCSFLQRSQSQGESGSKFPESDFFSVFELVPAQKRWYKLVKVCLSLIRLVQVLIFKIKKSGLPMMSEENVITLIMESNRTFTMELRIIMEQSCHHMSQ